MKAFIFAVLTLLFSTSYAGIDTRGLTEQQQAEIALQVARMKSSQEVSVEDKITKVNDTALSVSQKWAGVGKQLAIGIVETAKELGVAANEFATTPLGKLATALIVWNYMGKDIIHILASGILIFIGLPVIWHVFKWVVVEEVKYLEYKSWFFGLPRRKIVSKTTTDSEAFFFPAVVSLIAAIGLVVVAVNILPK